jgi:hypothetical protein
MKAETQSSDSEMWISKIRKNRFMDNVQKSIVIQVSELIFVISWERRDELPWAVSMDD